MAHQYSGLLFSMLDMVTCTRDACLLVAGLDGVQGLKMGAQDASVLTRYCLVLCRRLTAIGSTIRFMQGSEVLPDSQGHTATDLVTAATTPCTTPRTTRHTAVPGCLSMPGVVKLGKAGEAVPHHVQVGERIRADHKVLVVHPGVVPIRRAQALHAGYGRQRRHTCAGGPSTKGSRFMLGDTRITQLKDQWRATTWLSLCL